MRSIRIGTRTSALALWQARFVAAQLGAVAPSTWVEMVEIVSTGDERSEIPLGDVEGTGFFTATLERALLEHRIDVAVHSYKDLPVERVEGLSVAAVPARGPVADVLCARDRLTLHTLPSGAHIGTCSARRTAQVRAMRPDLEIRPLRGNVPTRLGRVSSGDFDAVVLARAGLVRLGLAGHITEEFSVNVMMPAPAQGALAVQCRSGEEELRDLLSALDDVATRHAVTAERALLHALGGGCSVPVGAVATWDGTEISLTAGVFALDEPRAIRLDARGTAPIALGESAARRLLEMGAGEILAAFDRMARVETPMTSGRTP